MSGMATPEVIILLRCIWGIFPLGPRGVSGGGLSIGCTGGITLGCLPGGLPGGLPLVAYQEAYPWLLGSLWLKVMEYRRG